MIYFFVCLFVCLPEALVDPGHISIPFCDDPEIVGHGAQYGNFSEIKHSSYFLLSKQTQPQH